MSSEGARISLESLPNELLLQVLIDAPDAVLSLRQVNRRFADLVTSHEKLIADRIFQRTRCGRAADRWSLSCDSYRRARNWRHNAIFYRKFWRVFGNKKIYSDCYFCTNSGFPFLDTDRFDSLMKSPLALAFIFHALSPCVEDDPKWYLASIRESHK
ncbi:hypothetical protein BFW01_g2948 [Lasiodiplodia theobromae]|uniref:F-box domain-containing protein n=1 Tax=Lasiodiplodia theobromae TaxID=45133 RepID=A0A5N5DFE9_9PEZI|nr:F-box domain-containing protein [Lasiodiplodia theobromae]KAB2576566.1 hypothetical protein DBV05_g4787 [Lasiodiplodia theobromae]KAF4546678.1 F-box domain-containing protein [Lasiodiplodia theobromae]KAF9632086.1 hypothetical protein BFW01_g2948 [Lasiodiplodia theobromae]